MFFILPYLLHFYFSWPFLFWIYLNIFCFQKEIIIFLFIIYLFWKIFVEFSAKEFDWQIIQWKSSCIRIWTTKTNFNLLMLFLKMKYFTKTRELHQNLIRFLWDFFQIFPTTSNGKIWKFKSSPCLNRPYLIPKLYNI